MRVTTAVEELVELVGCGRDELPELLAAMPPSPTNARRRRLLELRYLEGASLRAIAVVEGVSKIRVTRILGEALQLLRQLHRGDAALPTRIRGVMGLRLGGPHLADVVGDWDCAGLLRAHRFGIASLRLLQAELAARGLALRCGCPARVCDVAREKLATKKMVH